jgi:hypothetical protein
MSLETGSIEDKDLAWDMAHAELPYRELQALATHHGLEKIAKQMNGHANRSSHALYEENLDQLRTIRLEEIREEYGDTICTQKDFKRVAYRYNGGSIAWRGLIAKLQSEEGEQMPITLIPIVANEYAITGDFATAAWGMRHLRMGQLLGAISILKGQASLDGGITE